MKEFRRCSSRSSGSKRTYEEASLTEDSELISRNINDKKNNINKGKRRSISLSNNFFSVDDFSKYEDSLKLNNIEHGGEEIEKYLSCAMYTSLTSKIKNTSDDEDQGATDKKKGRKRFGKYIKENIVDLEKFKNMLFKKSLLYQMRCLNHNAAWILELSKGKGKGKSKSQLSNNPIYIKPFLSYNKFIRLFYEKKYKDAYILLGRICKYCFFPTNELNILYDNFFERKNYNLHYLVRSIASMQNSILHEKLKYNLKKRERKTNIFTKIMNGNTSLPPTKKQNIPFGNMFFGKDTIKNESLNKYGSTSRYAKNIKEKKKNKSFVNYKFPIFENYVNNMCNKFLQKDIFKSKYFTKKRGKKKFHSHYRYPGENSFTDRYTGSHLTSGESKKEMYRIENNLGDKILEEQKRAYSEVECKKIVNAKTCKEKKVNWTDDQMMRNCGERMRNDLFSKKKYCYKNSKDNMKVDIKLLIFLKMLSLYMYGHFACENNLNKIGNVLLYRKKSMHNYYETKSTYGNETLNIKGAMKKEILMYIARYMKCLKKKLEFDTYLYLLLSIVYYDLKKYNKSLFYVKKSIKKDNFNFISWVLFNNLISIEVFIIQGGCSIIGRCRKISYKKLLSKKLKNSKVCGCIGENISKKEKTFLKRNMFLDNSNRLKKLCSCLFENEFFRNINSSRMNVMKNYNTYIYINPFLSLDKSFFFKNNYFVSNIFSKEIITEGKKKNKKRGVEKKIKRGWKKNVKRENRVDNNQTNNSLIEKYQMYLQKHKFKKNIMSLFGFAHFCSLNNVLYKDSISTYEYLKRILSKNLYISCELAKLYYYNGKFNKCMKCFNKIQQISSINRLLKKEMINKCFIRYLWKRDEKEEHHSDNKTEKEDTNSEHILDCYNEENVKVISMKKYKNMKKLLVPLYFSDKYIYVELLANIFFFKKDLSSLFILVHNYQNEVVKSSRRIEAVCDEICFYVLGKYFSLCKNYNKSIFYFKKAIQKNRFHLYSYMSLAQEYFICGNVNSSIFLLIKMLGLYFNNSNAWFSLAKCLEYKEYYSFSVFSYKKAIYFQVNTIFYYFLANMYLKKGDIYNYIETLKRGWRLKKSILFCSKLFHVYFSILKEAEALEAKEEKTKELTRIYNSKKKENGIFCFGQKTNKECCCYKKNNDCFTWCVKYLKCYIKKLKKIEHTSSFPILSKEKLLTYNYYDDSILFKNVRHDNCVKYINKLCSTHFTTIYDKNTSFFFFFHSLRNSCTTIFEAIFYLANYFFFHKKFYNAMKLFQILWTGGGMYSELSFTLFRRIEHTLERKRLTRDGIDLQDS
ncbi:conserved Plasmodium protein, unknown function [Plasmodium malariae]|uniref:Tetratricopeptide repeat protein n=1 Tax=Plasmodium malariae TaxID=5858 RepID=A0A1C3KFY6_PLAMA|nr:conserved Plasmodium protein, unknown function [Plasmodium malariae]